MFNMTRKQLKEEITYQVLNTQLPLSISEL